jgi:hypothetical protein
MASAANAAGSNELKQVDVLEESTRKYVAWLCYLRLERVVSQSNSSTTCMTRAITYGLTSRFC